MKNRCLLALTLSLLIGPPAFWMVMVAVGLTTILQRFPHRRGRS